MSIIASCDMLLTVRCTVSCDMLLTVRCTVSCDMLLPMCCTVSCDMLLPMCCTVQALEATYRNLSSKLENFKVQYHEAFQLSSKQSFLPSDFCSCFSLLLTILHHFLSPSAVLQQGNRIPPDQVAKCKERKQLLDQICNRDADAMKRTCVVSCWL